MSNVKLLRGKTGSELQQELLALYREKLNLNMQKATRQLVQLHNLKKVKQKIAQVKTIMREQTGQVS